MMSSGFGVALFVSQDRFPLPRPHSLAGSLRTTIRVPAAPAMHPGLSTALPEIETLFLNSSSNIHFPSSVSLVLTEPPRLFLNHCDPAL